MQQTSPEETIAMPRPAAETAAEAALVSAIVPVHNAMPHLPACIKSILNQTVPVDEIICIDDGSTDESVPYLDELARTHPLVSVIRQECAGVSAARNRGLQQAHGTYVLFVDSDDFIAEDLVEKALACAQEHSAEMTIFGFDEYYGNSNIFIPREICPEEDLYGTAFSLADMMLPSPYLVTPNVWRILFDRAFLMENGLAFHEDLRTSEDLALIYEALFSAKRIALVPDRLYHYRRDGGETLTRKARGCAGIDALEYIRSFAAHRGVLERNIFHFCNIVLDVAEYATSTAYDLNEFLLIYRSFTGRLLSIVQKNETLVHERYRPFYENVLKGEQEYLFFLYARKCDSSEEEHERSEWRLRRIEGLEQNVRDVERDMRNIEQWARERIEDLERQLAESREETQQARQETADVRASHSYRLGNMVMRGPAAIKRALKGNRQN